RAERNFVNSAGTMQLPQALVLLAKPDVLRGLGEDVADPQTARGIETAYGDEPIRMHKHALPELRATEGLLFGLGSLPGRAAFAQPIRMLDVIHVGHCVDNWFEQRPKRFPFRLRARHADHRHPREWRHRAHFFADAMKA